MTPARRLQFTPERAEEHLAIELRAAALPHAFERQYAYVPERRFKADFAFPVARLLVEIQGGIAPRWVTRIDPVTGVEKRERLRGAHGSIGGVLLDNERLNLATLHGWRILRFTPDQVAKGEAISTIERCLRENGEVT